MAKTAADILVERLIEWGVDTIFGIPGDGINGIMEALRERQEQIRFVQVRHEEGAAFAAVAYAKTTGRLGVCLATSGPGGIHLLNGLYDAKLDSQPVLAITGLAFHDLINTHTQQDVELDKLFMDVCVYDNRIMGPAHVLGCVDLACRTALAYRGVSHLTIPSDVQEQTHEERSKRNIKHHSGDVFAKSSRLPNQADLQEAADLLNKGKKVAILAGAGALNATDELEEAAELLAAPIVKPLLGKACVPDDSPFTTGGIGLLGTKPSEEAMDTCETLLIVGSSFPYIQFYPKPGQAKAVQIELDPRRVGLRYNVDVGLVGDSAKTLAELNKLLTRKSDRSFLKKAQSGMKDWNKLMHERGSIMDKPMRPQVIAQELGKRIPSNAIVVSDSGTITTWWARHIPAKRGQIHTCSGNLATMACGLPYAVGAQIAHPDRPVFAFVGDGGFAMLMMEFITAVKYQLPIRVCVIKNNVLGQIKWEQMVFLGNPEYGVELQPIDFAAYARACGGAGFTIEDPKRCGDILDEALEVDGPVLIEAVVDPLTAPMPGKIKASQALHFAESLARGEPNRGKIAWENMIEDRVREMV
ncbi:MAG TPA: thiamine pyrophosphate-dependent enzyme [Terriglobales bacterium]|nr:thiamine pyrophosphate-dependent enzyme [Terriglobales bacterium]